MVLHLVNAIYPNVTQSWNMVCEAQMLRPIGYEGEQCLRGFGRNETTSPPFLRNVPKVMQVSAIIAINTPVSRWWFKVSVQICKKQVKTTSDSGWSLFAFCEKKAC